MFPARIIVSKPIIAAIVIVAFFWLASVVFAQGTESSKSAFDDLSVLAGRVVVILTLITIAVAAAVAALKNSALKEAQNLAAIRKEKLIEKELEISKKDKTIEKLEMANEELEKKNLRLQNPEHK
jgi:hypothetical protein